MANNYDAIVLGAGAMGSAAAYYLAKAGQKVLLLEQFEFNHQKGSSYGLSRIIRYAYDYPQYVELAKVVYPMWTAIEQESSEKLYTRTGGIDFGTSAQASLNNVIATLQQTGIPHEILTPTEARRRYPQFRFEDDMIILYQADTGILSASKSVLAHLRLAEQHGAELKPNTPILSVTPHPNTVEVKTADGTYTAAKLIVTAGSWAKSFLATLGLNLPLTPSACQEMYFETANAANYEVGVFPAFIDHKPFEGGPMAYGMASHQGSGLKVAWHGGKLYDHPTQIDYTPSQSDIDKALRFNKQYLPDVTGLRSARVCLYTMTPDEHWVLDKHPEYQHIVFAGGCSGHAFKFSTIIGKILTDLALTGETPHDISLFKASRFS
ncbi:MAG: N-methyl-L-tryptophan oxidase [Chloroflexi bacterium]|nr:N-methyl-L-tryptophan oxidase [Chloroflexota bacterium]MCC6891257.1 N-methyl-L-tryptophan oxidase [Anaerolineae bacterium]